MSTPAVQIHAPGGVSITEHSHKCRVNIQGGTSTLLLPGPHDAVTLWEELTKAILAEGLDAPQRMAEYIEQVTP